jgi:hypothetical protein
MTTEGSFATGAWVVSGQMGGRLDLHGLAELIQHGTEVHGTITVEFTMNGSDYVVQENVSGWVANGELMLNAHEARWIRTPGDLDWYPGQWHGQVADQNTIHGSGLDQKGNSASFTMRRQADRPQGSERSGRSALGGGWSIGGGRRTVIPVRRPRN